MPKILTKKRAVCLALIFVLTSGLFFVYTLKWAVRPLPASLGPTRERDAYADILDRHGYLLSLTRKNRFNHNPVPIWKIPKRLVQAFVLAEDKGFYRHGGVDWGARAKAFYDNLLAWKIVRGASTITEQCVSIIHPRPRTYYARVLETIEAYRLEKRFSKDEILEFYLNQVPYSHQCRGVAQAADFYFGRSLDTLNLEETLALAVMVRAPSFFNPKKEDPEARRHLYRRMLNLAETMAERGLLPEMELSCLGPDLKTLPKRIRVGAPHFVRHIKQEYPGRCRSGPRLATTLDRNLQGRFHELLKQSLMHLQAEKVKQAALLVVNHRTNEIIAWVNSSDFFSGKEESRIDAVRALRQPGSALKPFLYALALERGYTAATVIPDIPLSQQVGHGMHDFRNYSSMYYGPVRLRRALGSSLNVPAVRVVRDLGVVAFLDKLHELGFGSLTCSAGHYGVGLALGDGEVSLLELVRAYSVLAREGVYEPLNYFLDERSPDPARRVFSRDVCSIITDILSDPAARSLEFGSSGLLEFPVQTAVKTGTSSDYRDAWAVGYNYKYTAGVWMGNLDYSPTRRVSGSRGPAIVLRSVFNELNKHDSTRPLFVSPALHACRICALSGMRASPSCPRTRSEWFRPDKVPPHECTWHKRMDGAHVTCLPSEYHGWSPQSPLCSGTVPGDIRGSLSARQEGPGEGQSRVRMIQPFNGLHMALDPRIPDSLERFRMTIESDDAVECVTWYVDDELEGITGPGVSSWLWHPERGSHTARAEVVPEESKEPWVTPVVRFLVE